ELALPIPVTPDHFLGDLPEGVEWQAWRILSDIAGELREEFDRLVEDGEGFSDAALQILNAMIRLNAEVERLEEKLREVPETLRSVTELPTSQIPTVLPREDAIAREFRRLQLQVEADLVPIGEAVSTLHDLRAQLISLTQANGGLISANDEQLRLY